MDKYITHRHMDRYWYEYGELNDYDIYIYIRWKLPEQNSPVSSNPTPEIDSAFVNVVFDDEIDVERVLRDAESCRVCEASLPADNEVVNLLSTPPATDVKPLFHSSVISWEREKEKRGNVYVRFVYVSLGKKSHTVSSCYV